MRKIIVSMNMTADGFIAAPDGGLDWQFDHWTADMACALGEQLSRADTILLGRNTYVAMAAYWPFVFDNSGFPRDDIAYAMMMNAHHKIVCSSTLASANWHNTLILNNDILTRLLKLKAQPGKDIIVYGSPTLVQYLMHHQLVDEYQLWFYPTSLGSGLSLFKQQIAFKLFAIRQFESGVVVSNYRPLPW